MRSIAVAEWIIGRFTNKSQAASIIGDLVELKPQKGSLWFWLSLAGVVLSLTWRRPIAFVAALLAGSFGYGVFVMAIWRIHPQRLPEHQWMFVLGLLGEAGPVLLMVLMYAVIRYGLRDRFTQLALAFTSIAMAAVIYSLWQSVTLAVAIAVGIFVVAASIANKQRLKAALALTIAVAVGSVGSKLAWYTTAFYGHYLISGRMGDRELQAAHPSFVWMALCMYLLTVWLVTTVCSHAHGWLVRNISLDSEIESSR
jgi:hypothetical protein